MDIDRLMTRLNPWVVRLLTSRAHGLLSHVLMVVHVVGVRSGKRYDIPVGYQRVDDQLIVLVSKPRRKNWWRNYRAEVPIRLTIRGEIKAGTASLVDKESDMFRHYLSTTFSRVPGLSRQFGVARISSAGLTDQELAIVKLAAEMVAIRLH